MDDLALPGCTGPSALLLRWTPPPAATDDMASDSARALLIMVGSWRRRALMNQFDIWSSVKWD